MLLSDRQIILRNLLGMGNNRSFLGTDDKNLKIVGKSILKNNIGEVCIGTPGTIINYASSNFFISLFPIKEALKIVGVGMTSITTQLNKSQLNSLKVYNDILLSHEVIKSTDKVDKKFINKNDLIEFIHNVGAITIVLDSIELLTSFLEVIGKMFKHISVVSDCFMTQPITNLKNDKYSIIVSIIDIKESIAIFDERCVDGISIIIGILDKNCQSGKVYPLFSGIFSNHKSNILYIDGIKRFDDHKNKTKYKNAILNFKSLIKLFVQKDKSETDKNNTIEGVSVAYTYTIPTVTEPSLEMTDKEQANRYFISDARSIMDFIDKPIPNSVQGRTSQPSVIEPFIASNYIASKAKRKKYVGY